MRIVSLNTWKCEGAYRQRLDLMAEGLAALAPDLLLLQEVFATDDGQADTAAFLAQALSMSLARAPARRKPRRFEGESRVSTSGLALLSRHPLLSCQSILLPSDPADGERIVQLASVSHAGHLLWLANLHLSHLPDAGILRTRQLQTCLEALEPLAGNQPYLIGGDFNAAPGSAEMTRWLQPPWGLIDPFAGQPKVTHRSDAGRALDLDRVLLSRDWPAASVRQALVAMAPWQSDASMAASDHAAVVLDLSLDRLPSP